MFKATLSAARAVLLLTAGFSLAGCYQTDAKLFASGASLPVPRQVKCDFDGRVVTYAIKRSGGGVYSVTDADDPGNVFDAIFVRSASPLVYVVQVSSDSGETYYTTVNVLTWRLTKVADEVDQAVAAIAAAHGVTLTGSGVPTHLAGDDENRRAFLTAVADLNSDTMATCRPA